MDIDCSGTDEIVCPYCGYQFSDSGELADYGGGETQCDECNKNFLFEPDYSVSYCSWKADCLNGSPHKWLKPEEYLKGRFFRRCDLCHKREELRG